MNNDQNNQEMDNNQQSMRYQETIQGNSFREPGQRVPGPPGFSNRQSGPPGFPGFNNRPSGPPPGIGQGTGPVRPGAGPPSAPPNFTPQLPQEERQALSGPGGPAIRGGVGFRGRPRDMRGCINRFTYIWLFNGNNFWFYPVFVGRNTVEGFRWRRNGWDYDRINTNRILYHICF